MNIKFAKNLSLFKKYEYKIFKISNDTKFDNQLNIADLKKNLIISFDDFKKIGVHDFSYFNINFIKALLDKKCIGFIIFHKDKLVHIRWMSVSKNTHKFVDDISFHKYEKNGLFGVWGNAFTNPNYRGLGLNKISISECIKFLREKNFKFSFASVRSNNQNNIKTYIKIKKCYIYHTMIIKFLWFRFIF